MPCHLFTLLTTWRLTMDGDEMNGAPSHFSLSIMSSHSQVANSLLTDDWPETNI